MQRYLAIVAVDNNRVAKYLDFGVEADAQAHVSAHGGFVYDNVANDPLGDLSVTGQVVTVVPPVDEYKAAKIQQLQQEGLQRANDVFGEVVFGNVGQLRLLLAQFNTFQTDGSPDPLLVSVNNVRQAYQDAKTAIEAFTTKAEVEAYDVVNTPTWP